MNGNEQVFHKWMNSDINYKISNENVHKRLIQNLYDERLERSGFQFQEKQEVILEIHKIIDIKASLYIELPP